MGTIPGAGCPWEHATRGRSGRALPHGTVGVRATVAGSARGRIPFFAVCMFPSLYHPRSPDARAACERFLADATLEERATVAALDPAPIKSRGSVAGSRAPVLRCLPPYAPPTALGVWTARYGPVSALPDAALQWAAVDPALREALVQNPTMSPAHWKRLTHWAVAQIREGHATYGVEWLVLQHEVTGVVAPTLLPELREMVLSAHGAKLGARHLAAAASLWLDRTLPPEVLARYVALPMPAMVRRPDGIRAVGVGLALHPNATPALWRRMVEGHGAAWGADQALASVPSARQDAVVGPYLAHIGDPVIQAYLALDSTGELFWSRMVALLGRDDALAAAVLSHPDCRGTRELDPDFLGLLLTHAGDPVRFAALTNIHRTTDPVPLSGPPVSWQMVRPTRRR
jgi:hypothetical protein